MFFFKHTKSKQNQIIKEPRFENSRSLCFISVSQNGQKQRLNQTKYFWKTFEKNQKSFLSPRNLDPKSGRSAKSQNSPKSLPNSYQILYQILTKSLLNWTIYDFADRPDFGSRFLGDKKYFPFFSKVFQKYFS